MKTRHAILYNLRPKNQDLNFFFFDKVMKILDPSWPLVAEPPVDCSQNQTAVSDTQRWLYDF